MSRPTTVIRLYVVSMSRLIMRRVVDLPHPDGPMSTAISPSCTSRLRSPTAGLTWPGKTFATCSTPIMRRAEPARNLLRRGGRGRTPENREQRDRAPNPDDERHDEPMPSVEVDVGR